LAAARCQKSRRAGGSGRTDGGFWLLVAHPACHAEKAGLPATLNPSITRRPSSRNGQTRRLQPVDRDWDGRRHRCSAAADRQTAAPQGLVDPETVQRSLRRFKANLARGCRHHASDREHAPASCVIRPRPSHSRADAARIRARRCRPSATNVGLRLRVWRAPINIGVSHLIPPSANGLIAFRHGDAGHAANCIHGASSLAAS
jgi:hypothetical protein